MSANIESLRRQLSLEIEFLTQLERVLDEEKTALQDRDTEQIASLSEQKKSLITRLQSEAVKRAQLLLSIGKPENESALVFIRRVTDGELQDAWVKANERIAACLHKNEVNGRIIAHSQQRLNRVLSIIRGQSGGPQLYGQKGKQQAVSPSLRIASA